MPRSSRYRNTTNSMIKDVPMHVPPHHDPLGLLHWLHVPTSTYARLYIKSLLPATKHILKRVIAIHLRMLSSGTHTGPLPHQGTSNTTGTRLITQSEPQSNCRTGRPAPKPRIGAELSRLQSTFASSLRSTAPATHSLGLWNTHQTDIQRPSVHSATTTTWRTNRTGAKQPPSPFTSLPESEVVQAMHASASHQSERDHVRPGKT